MLGYPLNILLDCNLINSLATIRNELGQQLEKQLDIHKVLFQKNVICQNNEQLLNNVKIQETFEKNESNQEPKCEYPSSQKQSPAMKRKTIKKLVNCGVKNDTKNIPKNYGKAILSFIQKNSFQAKKLCQLYQVSFAEFMTQVRKQKTKINSIADLRGLWSQDDKENPMKKCFRILSYEFMRKYCLMYIFHSRVKNYGTHIKYRLKIIKGIQKPSQFTNIKEY